MAQGQYRAGLRVSPSDLAGREASAGNACVEAEWTVGEASLENRGRGVDRWCKSGTVLLPEGGILPSSLLWTSACSETCRPATPLGVAGQGSQYVPVLIPKNSNCVRLHGKEV